MEKGKTRSIQNRVKIARAVSPVFSDLAKKVRAAVQCTPPPSLLSLGRDTFCKASKEKSLSPFGTHSIFRRGGPMVHEGEEGGRLGNQDLQPRRYVYIRGKELRISQYKFFRASGRIRGMVYFLFGLVRLREFFSLNLNLSGVKVYRRIFCLCCNNWSPRLDVRYSLAKKTYVYPAENGCAYLNGFCNVSLFLRKTRGVSPCLHPVKI